MNDAPIAEISEGFVPSSERVNAYEGVLRGGTRPTLTVFVLLLTDVFAVTFVLSMTLYIKLLLDDRLWLPSYYQLWPVVMLFPLAYAATRLYPIVGFSPAEELRRLSVATTAVFVSLGVATFLSKDGFLYSRAVFVSGWILMLAAVPLARALTRGLCAKREWWGYPVVIMGAGRTGNLIARALLRQPQLGLRPIAILDDDSAKHGTTCGNVSTNASQPAAPNASVTVAGPLSIAPSIAIKYNIKHAVLAMPDVPHQQLLGLIEKHAYTFPHLIVVPDLFGFASLQVPAVELGGILGLEMRQQLLQPIPCFIKKTLDIFLSILLFPFVLLICLAIAILIKLESRGPALFLQSRPGRNGAPFKIVKFRTMHVDAEARYNSLSAEQRKEFETYGKIVKDPRVTRVGYWLRKTSLDELPQLWNVLKGEMSLVGPRAYLVEQVSAMKGSHNTIMKVRPGISGLWQVSGRSELSFDERLELDSYYVRNWSVWLDTYILARTILVVVKGKGAH